MVLKSGCKMFIVSSFRKIWQRHDCLEPSGRVDSAVPLIIHHSSCSLWRTRLQSFYSHFPNLQGTSLWCSKGGRMEEVWNVDNGINSNMLSRNTSSVVEWVITCTVCKMFHHFPLWDAAKGIWLLNAAEHLHPLYVGGSVTTLFQSYIQYKI